ncbi:hypothetical protein F4810DRAFT_722053 [Camillea tinctor]|nr:hypothetical protein F4810DRAFT_722053 [Camillea tinctor]
MARSEKSHSRSEPRASGSPEPKWKGLFRSKSSCYPPIPEASLDSPGSSRNPRPRDNNPVFRQGPLTPVYDNNHDASSHISDIPYRNTISPQRAVHKQKTRSKTSVSTTHHPAVYNVNTALSNDIAIFGTRGLLVPAYGVPEHYKLSNPPLTPTRPLLPPSRQSKKVNDRAREVAVRLYHCEALCESPEFNLVPGSGDLVSGAIAFLGCCEIRNNPPGFKFQKPNPGWVGLNLEREHGGFHLHYPGYVGSVPFHQNVSVDWEKVLRAHACLCSDDVLLIGVGLGHPGERCLSTETGFSRQRI